MNGFKRTEPYGLDDPRTTAERRGILAQNGLLRKIYQYWYGLILREIPSDGGVILELGTGAGFLQELDPGIITSDTFFLTDLNLVADGICLPFMDRSLRAIVLTNVFHHIPNAESFLSEASRCLIDGGKIVMIEPWISGWSLFVYKYFHHENVNIDAEEWQFTSHGYLSSANEALPWIVFYRDREKFQNLFPTLKVDRIEPFFTFTYLLSGGFSYRFPVPGWSFPILQRLETLLAWLTTKGAMFALISVVKN